MAVVVVDVVVDVVVVVVALGSQTRPLSRNVAVETTISALH